MRLLVYSLSGLLLAVATAVYLSRETGQVVLVFSEYSVQTTLGMFVFVILAGYILLYLLIRGVTGLIRIPERYRRRQLSHRHGQAEYYLARGMLALDEGDWSGAEKMFKQGARYSRWPAVNYIGAARAAQQLGAPDRRDSWLDLAVSDSADQLVATGIARAELQLDQQQTGQAASLLKQLNTDHPGNNRIRTLLLQVCHALEDWPQMLELLNEYERSGGMSVTDIRAGQVLAWGGILTGAARSANIDELNNLWHSVPAKLKKDARLIQAYVNGRLKLADTLDCEPLLREAIKTDLDPELIRLYGLVQGKDTGKQLAFIEKLLPAHPANGMLLLTAGRLYKRVALWGRARHCLEESLKVSPSAESCYELATMFEGQGDMENAGKYFRQGLKLAAA